MMHGQPNPVSLDDLTVNATGWWASDDGEFFSVGPEDSCEAAVAVATSEELGWEEGEAGAALSFTVAYCTSASIRFSSMFSADRFLEACEEDADDYRFEGEPYPFFAVSAEQQADLEARVRATLDEWQVAHRLRFVSTAFARTEHRKTVRVPLQQDDALQKSASTAEPPQGRPAARSEAGACPGESEEPTERSEGGQEE